MHRRCRTRHEADCPDVVKRRQPCGYTLRQMTSECLAIRLVSGLLSRSRPRRIAMKNTLASLLLITATIAGAAGCVVRTRAAVVVDPPPVAVVEVEEEPPPPRVVVVTARPGFLWVEGRWN